MRALEHMLGDPVVTPKATALHGSAKLFQPANLSSHDQDMPQLVINAMSISHNDPNTRRFCSSTC